MVYLVTSRRYPCNSKMNMNSTNKVCKIDLISTKIDLNSVKLTRMSLPEMNSGIRPDSMARILLNSSKPNTSGMTSLSTKLETTAATVTRIISPNSINSTLPVCDIRMTSKLKTLLLEGRKKELEDGERLMMPPPPPPAPKLLLNSFDCSTDDNYNSVKAESDCFSFGDGGELELLAEAAIATDPRDDEFYDQHEFLQGKDVVNNLGRNKIIFLFICFLCNSVMSSSKANM